LANRDEFRRLIGFAFGNFVFAVVWLILQDSVKMRGRKRAVKGVSRIFEVVNHVIQEAANIKTLIYKKYALTLDRATVQSEYQAGQKQ
jgi:hypothetical protein